MSDQTAVAADDDADLPEPIDLAGQMTADQVLDLVADYAGWAQSLGAWKMGNPETGLSYSQTRLNRDVARDAAFAAIRAIVAQRDR